MSPPVLIPLRLGGHVVAELLVGSWTEEQFVTVHADYFPQSGFYVGKRFSGYAYFWKRRGQDNWTMCVDKQRVPDKLFARCKRVTFYNIGIRALTHLYEIDELPKAKWERRLQYTTSRRAACKRRRHA